MKTVIQSGYRVQQVQREIVEIEKYSRCPSGLDDIPSVKITHSEIIGSTGNQSIREMGTIILPYSEAEKLIKALQDLVDKNAG